MVDKGFDKNSIYTVQVENETELFVIGIDKDNKRRGINKRRILDWLED